MFLNRNKKNNVYPCKPQFYYIKVGFKGVKYYRHVFVMHYDVDTSAFFFFFFLFFFFFWTEVAFNTGLISNSKSDWQIAWIQMRRLKTSLICAEIFVLFYLAEMIDII